MKQVSESNGNVLVFEDDKEKKIHRYILNGEVVPGVTTLNRAYPSSPHLTTWIAKQAAIYTIEQLKTIAPEPVSKLPDYLLEEIAKKSTQAGKAKAKEAASIGSLVHDYAEQYDKNQSITPELNEKIKQHVDKKKIESCIEKYHDWMKGNKDEIISQEEIIASVLYRYGGKYDTLRRRGSRTILSDYKTSTGIHTEYLIQLGAYALALEEWRGIKVDAVEVIRFGKTGGEFETKLISNQHNIEEFKKQFIRNIETYKFREEWE
jgi:predicted RecB family nuclease